MINENKVVDQQDADVDIGISQAIPIKTSCPGDNTCNERCVENGASMYSVRFEKNKDQHYHRYYVPFSDFAADEIDVKTCQCRIVIYGRREKNTCDAKLVEYLFKVIRLPETYLRELQITTKAMFLRGKTTVIVWVPVQSQ